MAMYLTMARAIRMLFFATMLAVAACIELASQSGRKLQQQLSDKIAGGYNIINGVRLLVCDLCRPTDCT